MEGLGVEPEAEDWQTLLREVQVFRSREAQPLVEPPSDAHCLCSVEDDLGVILLLGKLNAGTGQGLAGPRFPILWVDAQQADTGGTFDNCCETAGTVLRHIAEVDDSADQVTLGRDCDKHLRRWFGQYPFTDTKQN